MLLCLSVSSYGQEDSWLLRKTMATTQAVEDPDRQVGNYNGDSIPNLPIGLAKEINGAKYIIAIDSAYFLPDGAYFSAYMAIHFPGADKKIAFAARDIKFNPEGVLGGEQAKLQLVSEHQINMGPNTRLYLPDDGSNYVKWNCNGFESVNLSGAFLFAPGMLKPDPESGDSLVSASFEVNVTDIHNMLATVDFSPFQIKGMDDLTFSVTEATVDMSDFINPPGAALPAVYHETYSDDILLWRGFHLKSFVVSLPDEMSKNEGSTNIYAKDIFIDDAGVTGFFGADNLFTTSEGSMAGKWGFSIENLEIGLTTNKLTSGAMSGEIGVPALDNNNLNYDALLSQAETTEKLNFSFSVNPEEAMTMNAFNSTLTIDPASTVTVARWEGKFQPSVILHGDLTVNNDNLKLNKLEFEQITIVTEAPYITDGIFALVSDSEEPENEAGKFPIQLSNIMFGIVDLKPVFGCDIALNLGKADSPNNFSVETGVRVYCQIEQSSTGKYNWEFDRLQLMDILIDMQTNPFTLKGLIAFHNDDPVYGSGFYGALEFKINSVMPEPLKFQCAFGKLPAYKYWMVDVTVPVLINVTAQIQISSISGGLAYHMDNTKTNQNLIDAATAATGSSDELSMDYIPNEDAGIYFKTGVGVKHTASEQIFNGDLIFSIGFNSSGGFSFVQFDGITYSLCKRSERATASNYVMSHTQVNYDHEEKIFNAQMVSEASFADAIYANVWAQIYLSPGHWHFHVGRPDNPGVINVLNFVTAEAYFMMGQDLPPMPPPPPEVSSVIAGISDQRDEGAAAEGSGVATGLNFIVGFEGSEEFLGFQVYGGGYAGSGFDMTLYKYADGTHCAWGDPGFGMNNWYLEGQLYAYMGLGCGIAGKAFGKDFDITLISGNAAMLLQGQMPKPTYVYGAVYLDATILSVINVEMDFDFDAGTNCEIVSG